jgi:hypothetical protein
MAASLSRDDCGQVDAPCSLVRWAGQPAENAFTKYASAVPAPALGSRPAEAEGSRRGVKWRLSRLIAATSYLSD